jgi:DNA-binding PadR family transcriptional regulator
MWYTYSSCGPGRGRRRGGFGAWAFAGPEAWAFRRGFRGGRFFEQGDLKYVILQLLAEKPRHGYEIIKALEEKFGGAYAPSAGAVYPTLAMLEDLGYAVVTPEEGGKKVYAITEEGRKYLSENQGTVDDLFERIADIGSSFLSDGMRDVGKALGRVASATFAPPARYLDDPEVTRRVCEILEQARRDIEDAARGPKDRAAPGA